MNALFINPGHIFVLFLSLCPFIPNFPSGSVTRFRTKSSSWKHLWYFRNRLYFFKIICSVGRKKSAWSHEDLLLDYLHSICAWLFENIFHDKPYRKCLLIHVKDVHAEKDTDIYAALYSRKKFTVTLIGLSC